MITCNKTAYNAVTSLTIKQDDPPPKKKQKKTGEFKKCIRTGGGNLKDVIYKNENFIIVS